jgi:polar amino acid transport system substrate-binding protein
MLSVLGSALAAALTLASPPSATAADMIGNCELIGAKGSIPLTPAKEGQLTVETSLPAPGWWNGDTPETIADGFEYCMAANIANRAGLDKLEVVNVAGTRWSPARPRISISRLADLHYGGPQEGGRLLVPYFSSDIGVLVKKGTKVDEVSIKTCASASSRRPPAPTSSTRS